MSERINKPHDEAQYRRRTGPPLPGCDCMQCFGYCLVNADIRDREIRARGLRTVTQGEEDALSRAD